MIVASWVCLFAPLGAAVAISLGGNLWSRRAAGYLATASVATSFVASTIAFFSALGREHDDRS